MPYSRELRHRGRMTRKKRKNRGFVSPRSFFLCVQRGGKWCLGGYITTENVKNLQILNTGSVGIVGASIVVVLAIRSPEGQVVAEQLHDQGAVLVRLLREGVKLSNRIVESLLSQVASAVGRVEDLVVEIGRAHV